MLSENPVASLSCMMITKTNTTEHDPPSYEEAWTQSLNGLQQQMAAYEIAQRSGDDRAIEEEAPKVALAMRQVGDSHTDPKVKAVWYKKANKFLRSNGKARRNTLKEVGHVVVTLVRLPFVLTGVALYVAGNIVQGVGSLISGIGELVAGKTPEHSDKRSETSKSVPRRGVVFLLTSWLGQVQR